MPGTINLIQSLGMPLSYPLRAALAFLALTPMARAASSPADHVLFAFDDHALPLQHGLRLKLFSSQSPGEGGAGNIAVPQGAPGSCDGRGVIYYGTVREVGGELWMWYLGMGDRDPDRHYRVCLAKSHDGKKWDKPDLGLVEYGGSRHNNLVDLDQGKFSVAGCVVFYEPEDPDPGRRFKMLFTGTKYPGLHFGVAYSPDGLSWRESPANPRGAIKFEPQGAIRWKGAYYVNGQGGLQWAPDGWIRALVTHISYDFENWTEATALGFRRDPLPPRAVEHTGGIDGEQVHLGAALWDRGDVVVGLYGQWHGAPTNDRRWATMDIGLVVSHDALHFTEPIPDFRIIPARENTSSWLPSGHPTLLERAPAVMQGQGFANLGDETLFWYSIWVVPSAGIRYARWDRDRFGCLQPFVGPSFHPHLISAPLATGGLAVRVRLNIGGLGKWSQAEVSVLDVQLRPVAGYSAAECTGPTRSGLSQLVTWKGSDRVNAPGPIRLRVDFAGVRPEDTQLYAVYLEPAP